VSRNAVLIALIVVCFAVAAALIFKSTEGPAGRLGDVIEHGSAIHVMCANQDCGHCRDDFRAHSYDRDWPKKCDKCGKKTLCRAVLCPTCKKYTPWHADAKGRVYCVHCKRWLNPTPPGGKSMNTP
jgi:hypothetical protein